MKRTTATELHIGKDIIPEGTELRPGDFGLSESQLSDMAKAGQVKEDRPKRQSNKEVESE